MTTSASICATSATSAVETPSPTPHQRTENSQPALARYYYHANRLYSVSALTDAAGTVVERYQYNAYGLCTTFNANYELPLAFSRFGNPFTFTGRELDPEIEAMHYRSRTLLLRLGTFGQQDPIGYQGGINLYQYVGGRPVGALDPLGWDWLDPNTTFGFAVTFVQNLPSAIVDNTVKTGVSAVNTVVQIAYQSADGANAISQLAGGPGYRGSLSNQGKALDSGQIDAATAQLQNTQIVVSGGTAVFAYALADYLEGKITVDDLPDRVGGPAVLMGGLAGILKGAQAVNSAIRGAMGRTPCPTGGGAGNTAAQVPTGDTYSVAYQMSLDRSVWGRSDSVHFNRANAALDTAIRSDPQFAAQMERLIPGVSDSVSSVGGRAAPNGWLWHHATEPGVMQLVPEVQHMPGSIFQDMFHPNGQGGYAIWAYPNGAPKR